MRTRELSATPRWRGLRLPALVRAMLTSRIRRPLGTILPISTALPVNALSRSLVGQHVDDGCRAERPARPRKSIHAWLWGSPSVHRLVSNSSGRERQIEAGLRDLRAYSVFQSTLSGSVSTAEQPSTTPGASVTPAGTAIGPSGPSWVAEQNSAIWQAMAASRVSSFSGSVRPMNCRSMPIIRGELARMWVEHYCGVGWTGHAQRLRVERHQGACGTRR